MINGHPMYQMTKKGQRLILWYCKKNSGDEGNWQLYAPDYVVFKAEDMAQGMQFDGRKGKVEWYEAEGGLENPLTAAFSSTCRTKQNDGDFTLTPVKNRNGDKFGFLETTWQLMKQMGS